MSGLRCKTRVNAGPEGKPRIYFCCHPEDFNRYFEVVSDELLAKQNCAVWYSDTALTRDEDFLADLKQMQLFVMPVTAKLLCTENEALDIDFRFAVENHIPVLPLMQEGGLEEIFNSKCGDIQFLDKNNTDATAIGYDEKLEKYLKSVLIGDELAEKIRAAFDAYVFLSYRKKDRKYARELMHLIHRNEFCRDIAIWYDEFLTPGENFNDSIKEALQKSGLFVLAVTPNLVNESNYIMTTEYPMAKQEGKPILPAELVPTDRKQLFEKYDGIPVPTDAYNESELSETLLNAVKSMAVKENDASPEHNFFIGLAYLGGIDVEVDYDRAVSLITNAAEAGLVEAADKLYNMYLNGIGVKRDYDEAAKWFDKKIGILRKNTVADPSESNYTELISELILFGEYYKKTCGNDSEAKRIYTEAYGLCEDACQKFRTLFFKRKQGLCCTYIAQAYMDEKEYDLAQEKLDAAYRLMKDTSDGQLKEIVGNIKTATVGQLIDYYASNNDLATLYEGLAEIAYTKNEHGRAEEYLLRCLELRQEFEKHFSEHSIAVINTAISYLALARHYKMAGDLPKAIAYCEKGYPKALETANQTGYLYAGEVCIRINMLRAQIHVMQDEKAQALECYITNIGHLERSSLSQSMQELKAENYYQASKLSYFAREFLQAVNFIAQYLQICSGIYDEKRYTEIFSRELDYMTDCYIGAGIAEDALKIHRKVLDSKYNNYMETGTLEAAIIYNMGMLGVAAACVRCKAYDEAMKYFKASLSFAESLKVKYRDAGNTGNAISVIAYTKIAEMYKQRMQRSKVKKYYSLAVKQALKNNSRDVGDYRQVFETYGTFGDWYKSENNFKSALKCYSNAIHYAEESVMVYGNEEDKCFLASLYLTAGTIKGKNSNEMLNRSRKLWQELLGSDPTSERYRYGNDMACRALGIDPEGASQTADNGGTEPVFVTLTNENGDEESFELLDVIEVNGCEYAVLMPADNDDGNVLILQVQESENGTTNFTPVDDDELLSRIFDIFKERNKDKMNFTD